MWHGEMEHYRCSIKNGIFQWNINNSLSHETSLLPRQFHLVLILNSSGLAHNPFPACCAYHLHGKPQPAFWTLFPRYALYCGAIENQECAFNYGRKKPCYQHLVIVWRKPVAPLFKESEASTHDDKLTQNISIPISVRPDCTTDFDMPTKRNMKNEKTKFWGNEHPCNGFRTATQAGLQRHTIPTSIALTSLALTQRRTYGH